MSKGAAFRAALLHIPRRHMSGNDNTSYTVRVVSATTTLTNNDYVLSVESPAANVTVNLPQLRASSLDARTSSSVTPLQRRP
ncbi:hypothetical protein [Streptomyces phage JXY1]|uniref:Uncharacterized protein n=1 Tax=Streptomyces phage JXY1 TaxID=2708562 RepID=A0A6C0RSE0_9CAUD|nr:hypothetical protein HWD10_gp08 [Streptomyces phage JXY1]QIA28801.1 hypothetical protein [Streptomyces phage JXY1]